MAMRLPTAAGGAAFGPSFGARAQLRPSVGDVHEIPVADLEGESAGAAKDHQEGLSSPRSVSPGSTSAGSGISPRLAVSSPYSSADLLAHSYPVPVVVRNTFIDTLPSRPASLDGFFKERATVSAPGSGLEPGARPREEEEEPQQALAPAEAPATLPPAQQPPAQSLPVLPPGVWALPPAVMAPAAAVVPAAFADASPLGQASPAASFATATPPAAVMVLPVGPVGSPDSRFQDLPSAGSAGHAQGNCKPCAFFHTKGCASGMDCVFCHLCPAGEKKRRSKDKREERKDRKMRQEYRSWFGHT